jgi:glutamine amidotransferase
VNSEVAILDYGVGNLHSVSRACKKFSNNVKIVNRPEDLSSATHLIFPGVGTFGVAMNEIIDRGLKDSIFSHIGAGKFVLGICVGMQIFARRGTENGLHEGLGLMDAEAIEIDQFVGSKTIQKPNMGWSEIEVIDNTKSNRLLKGTASGESVYFAHSFALNIAGSGSVTSKVTIGSTEIPASVEINNIFGVQFHPEKSGEVGLRILKKFIELGIEE